MRTCSMLIFRGVTDLFFVKKMEIRVEENTTYINDSIKFWYDLMDVIAVFE